MSRDSRARRGVVALAGLALAAGLTGCSDERRVWSPVGGSVGMQPIPAVKCSGGSASYERAVHGVLTQDEVALCREALRSPVKPDRGFITTTCVAGDCAWRWQETPSLPSASGASRDAQRSAR